METVDLGRVLQNLSVRLCPSCRRSFRLRSRDQEASGLAREAARRLPHANPDEIPGGQALARCPYCGRRAQYSSFLTAAEDDFLAATSAWLSAVVTYEQLAFVERTLGQNPYQTFYVLSPQEPARPAPAQENLRPVPLGCCGGEIELDPAWLGEICCPYCGGATSPPA